MDIHHFVCAHDEARAIIEAESEFWLSDCGCRVAKGRKCRSRVDVCLGFAKGADTGGSVVRRAALAEVLDVLAEADRHRLVTRPYVFGPGDKVAGMCFCCDCCCDYFSPAQTLVCAPGAYRAADDQEICDDCGLCAEACYFGARTLADPEGSEAASADPRPGPGLRRLTFDPARCSGCGLCAPSCPQGAIRMVRREESTGCESGY